MSLDVRGKRSLQDSLEFYVQSELMEGENQYLCEEAGQKASTTFLCCLLPCLHVLANLQG